MKKTKEFLHDISINRENLNINIPYWYEYIFFKKNILTRFKQNKFFLSFTGIYISFYK